MSKPHLVIYHGGGCRDGFCAAWLFHRAFPDAEFIAANYGEPPPANIADRFVYVVDFSYPRAVIKQMAESAYKLIVLDHHKTAAADLMGLQDELDFHDTRIRFDMDKSGGRLAWDYLSEFADPGKFPKECPWLVDYTEDRDLWRHNLPNTKEINACLRSYPLEFAVWDKLAGWELQMFVIEGTAILRAEQQIVETHVRHAHEIEVGGYRVWACNATVLQSEIAGELAADRPFGVCYFDTPTKRIWSLRSRDGGIDVSEVAKRFGGGGHRNAAGYQTDLWGGDSPTLIGRGVGP